MWKHVSGPNPSGTAIGRANGLDAVAATSVSNAWAAGGSVSGGAVNNSFLPHWNGTAWKRVPSP